MRGEYSENEMRKQFVPSKRVAIADAAFPAEKAKAKERQKIHGNTAPGRKNTPGKFPEVKRGEAKDRVAKSVGMDRKTFEKAKARKRMLAGKPSGKFPAPVGRAKCQIVRAGDSHRLPLASSPSPLALVPLG